MNKEMICKNCKYHYIEEISFDYPQSCCSKRMATTEEWCKCNDFEYGNRYIELLQQENKQLKDNWNNLKKDIGYELLKLREPNEYNNGLCNAFNYINNKMQELEGSDSDEKI